VAHAAEAPLVVNERVETLAGIGEIFGGFAECDPMKGEDAVLEGVVARYGLAPGGVWTGGF
jgi:hypothetical protein